MEKFIGLSTRDAADSALRHGTNELSKKERESFFKKYLASFGDPIIRILLVALGVNLLLLFRDANWYESAGIAIAVLLATLISTLSEYGSESAFEKLQEEAANIKCRVKRNGRLVELPIAEIVVGDIVHIGAGERIPADGILVSGNLDADQSTLNGETKEARKSAVNSYVAPTGDFLSQHELFRGSVVCAGEGIMIVTQVGDSTFYGKLAEDIQEAAVESPLKARLAGLAQTISRFGYAAAVFVVIANLFNSIVLENNFNGQLIANYFSDYTNLIRDIMNAFTLGITVIVMAVPEGLPMMITVVLSANMRRMLKDNVLVRKLVGIETSGSMNILFADKTGTLTKGMLEVVSFISAEGKLFNSKQFKKTPLFRRVALNCFYNNSAQLASKKMKTVAIGGNSTDRALLEYVMEQAARLPLCKKGFMQAFDSKTKLSITAVNGEFEKVFIKGAPEILLPACNHAFSENEGNKSFAPSSELKAKLQIHARDGMRILALCEAENAADAKAKRNLTLVGFIGIRDEIRKEARAAINEVLGAGVQVVMVTGDNLDTAVSVAAKLGLVKNENEDSVITSRALNQLSDEQVKKILPRLRVIARALPSDKGRLVRLSQEMGLVAGMTGDGVNDAPALKKADVGFVMGDGTEIAKEAGDIVILDNNFASIVKAVLYGRTIFKSIRKFLIFQLTINICAVGVSVIGPFIGVPVPVTVIQMLWINMIMDTLAGLAYAGETPLAEYMRELPKKRTEPIINKYMFNQILATGIYTTLLSLAFFKLPFITDIFRNDERYLLTAFFALFIFAGVFNSLNARTHRINLLAHIERNKMFITIMLAVAAIQMLIIYFGGTVFRTTGLSFKELAIVIALASTVIVFDLARKLFLRLNNRKGFI
ncbi:MAG: calcium-translocating P-type ATPase, PMCA-type [Clostridiales bacterium]|jgi:calcium-translocating P-type ATPase|nr:calcium-translocating P-type ATPase, PMCA-type [Clostridiales bacterium]